MKIRSLNIAIAGILFSAFFSIPGQSIASSLVPTYDNAVPAAFGEGIENSDDPSSQFKAISCPSAGNCTAVGPFHSPNGYEGFGLTQANGVWGSAVPASFGDISQNADFRTQEIYDVSCASAGNCTAVGTFVNGAEREEAFMLTQTAGIWSTATSPMFDDGVRNVNRQSRLSSVSCPTAGNCTAVGEFINPLLRYEAFTITETNGVWAKAKPAQFATGTQSANPSGGYFSVSCSSAGNCTAVGSYENSTENRVPFAQTQTDGVWAQAEPTVTTDVFLAGSTYASLNSIACTSAGNCTAIGYSSDDNDLGTAFAQTLTDGIWAQPEFAKFADGVLNASYPDHYYEDISCSSAGSCTAVGTFANATGHNEAFAQTQIHGVWGQAEPAKFGTGIQSPDRPRAELKSISCTSAGYCTGAGFFTNPLGRTEPFTQTQVSGVWTESAPATFSDGVQYSNLGVRLGEFRAISCSSSGDCTAAGRFLNSLGKFQAFTQTIHTPVAPKPTQPSKPGSSANKPTQKSVIFVAGSSKLTAEIAKAIKRTVKLSGTSAYYTVVASAGQANGVEVTQVNNLAKKRGAVIKAFLVKLGVTKSHIKITIKIFPSGQTPKTKILTKLLSS